MQLSEVFACLIRAEENAGGKGSHGRKRGTAGHIKAVLSRAQVTTQVYNCCHYHIVIITSEIVTLLSCTSSAKASAVHHDLTQLSALLWMHHPI